MTAPAKKTKKRLLRHGDRVVRAGVRAKVIDVHEDKEHVSVLPDVPASGPRELVRWRVTDTERAS